MNDYGLIELQNRLSSDQLTSLDLVKWSIQRINQYDQNGPKINAIAEMNPDVYQIASMLDRERKTKGPRSLLHGIPIVIKDNILTQDKMHTTAGSIALKDYYGIDDAFVVKKLREAGAIILGKANLSEFAYFMSFDDMPSGYGGLSGQVKSPYSHKIDPLGSSTGSAVSVACDYVPASIGTETNGSLTAPALMNAIQTIKPTMGMVSRTGIIPISHHQDIAGPMAKKVEDLAAILDVIYGYDPEDLATYAIKDQSFDFNKALHTEIKNKRIGFVKFTNIKYTDEQEKIEAEAKKVFINEGYEVIDLEVKAEQIKNFETLIYDFKVDLNHFFNRYMSGYHIHSLKDLIQFNQQDPKVRMKYGQSIFEAAENTSGTLREEHYHQVYQENLDKANLMTRLLKKHDLISIASVIRTGFAPIAGNPVVAVVAKELVDDQPQSMYFIGEHFSDPQLLRVAYVYEQATQKRVAPDLDHIR